ncbi:unnamed protein product [Closterium sp. NIES-53]
MTGPATLTTFILPLMRRSRIQWGLGLLWIVFCLKVMKDSVDRMDRSLQSLFFYEAFLYYNPLLMIALMVWLWGINLYGLAHSRVSYAKVFDLDHSHLTHTQIWQVSAALSLAVLSSMTAYMFLFSHGLINLAATQPVRACRAGVGGDREAAEAIIFTLCGALSPRLFQSIPSFAPADLACIYPTPLPFSLILLSSILLHHCTNTLSALSSPLPISPHLSSSLLASLLSSPFRHTGFSHQYPVLHASLTLPYTSLMPQ